MDNLIYHRMLSNGTCVPESKMFLWQQRAVGFLWRPWLQINPLSIPAIAYQSIRTNKSHVSDKHCIKDPYSGSCQCPFLLMTRQGTCGALEGGITTCPLFHMEKLGCSSHPWELLYISKGLLMRHFRFFKTHKVKICCPVIPLKA